MQNKPLHDKALLEALPKEEKTKSGLYLPDSILPQLMRGKLIDVSDGCLDVKKGDVVLYESGAGSEVEVDGKMLLLISESRITMIESREDKK